MKAKITPFLLLFALLNPAPVTTQGRFGGNVQQLHPQGAGQGQGQRGAEMGKGTLERDQKRIRATIQQRDQLRSCDRSADQVRKRARTLARTAQNAGAQAGAIGEQTTQLRQQFRSMLEEHNRLLESLDTEQRTRLQEQIRNMQAIRERVEIQLSAIETGSARSDPDRKRIAERARELEQHLKEWQRQYRTMNRQMVTR